LSLTSQTTFSNLIIGPNNIFSSGAEITFNNDALIYGTMNLLSGFFNVNGLGSILISGSMTCSSYSTISNKLIINGTAVITINNSPTFSGIVTIVGPGKLETIGAGSPTFSSGLIVSSNSKLSIGGTSFTINIDITVSSTILFTSGSISGTGSITLNTGCVMTCSSSGTISNKLITNSGGLIIITNSPTFYEAASIYGSLTISGVGAPTFSNLIIDSTAEFIAGGALVTFNGAITSSGNIRIDSGSVNGIGVITINSGAISFKNPSSVSNSLTTTGSSQILISSSLVFKGDVSVSGSGFLKITSGSPVFSSTLSIGQGSSLIAGGSSLTINGKAYILGNFNLTSGVVGGIGEIVIQNGGAFSCSNDYPISTNITVLGTGQVSNCVLYVCNGIPSTNPAVCSGQGKCEGYNKCNCYSGLYTGANCDNSSGLIALLVIFISCFLLCIICIFFGLVITIIFIIIYNDKKQKKFLIKNKELADRLAMMSDLNKIPFNSIKFEKKNGENLVLGKGASSIVYKGTYKENQIAIKEVSSVGFDENLITEIVLLKNLDCKYIIKYYGYSIDFGGNFFVITEFMGKGCLSSHIKDENSLTIEQKLCILIDICSGMRLNYK
jgi:hypothetical protein